MLVAERDLDKPTATLRVACPECGDAQMIDADRMISITREKGATTGSHSSKGSRPDKDGREGFLV